MAGTLQCRPAPVARRAQRTQPRCKIQNMGAPQQTPKTDKRVELGPSVRTTQSDPVKDLDCPGQGRQRHSCPAGSGKEKVVAGKATVGIQKNHGSKGFLTSLVWKDPTAYTPVGGMRHCRQMTSSHRDTQLAAKQGKSPPRTRPHLVHSPGPGCGWSAESDACRLPNQRRTGSVDGRLRPQPVRTAGRLSNAKGPRARADRRPNTVNDGA